VQGRPEQGVQAALQRDAELPGAVRRGRLPPVVSIGLGSGLGLI